MRVARLGVTATLFLSTFVFSTTAHAKPPLPVAVDDSVEATSFSMPDVVQLQAQMKVKGTMPPAYWHAVSKCEVNGNWKDKGTWGGGVGMAITTWVGYGGRQFASHPSKATVAEQMIVANRVAVLGYQTKNEFLTLADREANRPFFRPASGFTGWGCIRNNHYLRPQVWRDNNRTKWRQSKKDVLSTLWISE